MLIKNNARAWCKNLVLAFLYLSGYPSAFTARPAARARPSLAALRETIISLFFFLFSPSRKKSTNASISKQEMPSGYF